MIAKWSTWSQQDQEEVPVKLRLAWKLQIITRARNLHKIIKFLHIHFYKTYDHQIWKTGTSQEVYSLGTNKVGASNVISLKSRGVEKNAITGLWFKQGLCSPNLEKNDLQETPNKLRLILKLLMMSFFKDDAAFEKLFFSRAYEYQIWIVGLLRHIN